MRQITIILSLLIFFASLSPTTAYAGFEEGKAAYEKDDWYQAILNLRPLADQGDTNAMMLLANMYHEGKGVKQDFRLAFDMYQKAAKAGNSFAMISLAAMYSEGQAVPANKKKALEYYQKAANAGNQVGQFVMAAARFTGMKDGLLEQDIQRSYFWTLTAANNPVSDPILSQKTVMFLAKLEKEFITELADRNRLKKEAHAFLKEHAPNISFPMLDTENPVDLSTVLPRGVDKLPDANTEDKPSTTVEPVASPDN